MEAGVKAVGCIICMLKCGNNLLYNKHGVAVRAMLAFSQTGCGTGRLNRRVDNLAMHSGTVDNLALLFATITVTSFYAVFGAGGVLGY